MKKEYDFSKAKRGLFYHKNTKLKIPVYLDEKSLNFISEIAQRKNTDISSIANMLIKSEMKLVESIK